MSLYINPPKMSHTDFVRRFARSLTSTEVADSTPEDKSQSCLICLVLNPGFTALAIISSKPDLTRWSQPDRRPKQFYLTSTKDVNEHGGVGITIS